MSTTVGELVDEIRDHYLALYRQKIAELEQAGMQTVAEPTYLEEDGSLAREGALNLPLRLDLVGVVDDQAVERVSVDSETMLSFDPIEFEWAGGLAVQLAPFHWDACDIRAAGISGEADWSRLREWFDQWFDGGDTRPADEQGLHGIIHFLSDPFYDGSATTFQVDFGSAPEAAFEELLSVLRDSGATKIEITHNLLG